MPTSPPPASQRFGSSIVSPTVVYVYGADPTGATDSTAAIQAALSTAPPAPPPGRLFQGISVYLPAGIYKVSATLLISQNGTAFFGDGPESTVIMMSGTPGGGSTTNLPVIATGITSSGTLSYASIRGMTVTRDTSSSLSYPATAGGNGINAGFPGIVDCLIANVFSTNHWAGFALGSVAYGVVLDCQAALCKSHGFYLQNDITSQTPANLQASIQWMMMNQFSQLNDGWGFYLQTAVPPGGSIPFLAVYPWFYPVTFGNGGGGCFIGGVQPPEGSTISPCSVSTFHVVGGFFGQDNFHGIYINSY